jgi:hypothetical protein
VNFFVRLTAFQLILDRGQYFIDPHSVSLQAERRWELIYPKFQRQYPDLLSWKMRIRAPKDRVNKIIPPSEKETYIFMLQKLKNICINNRGEVTRLTAEQTVCD